MIYTYHIVKSKINDTITITPWRFFLDMLKLMNKQVIYLEDYDTNNQNQVVITFDDGYINFKKYALPILKIFRYPFELFVVGDWVGKNGFLSQDDLKEIVSVGGRLEYHTKTHANLEELKTNEEIFEEISVPENLKELDKKGFHFLAYPFWKYNENVIRIARDVCHYKGALSGNGYGDNSNNFALNRIKKG